MIARSAPLGMVGIEISGNGAICAAFSDTNVAVFDVATGRQLRMLNASAEIVQLAITDDGKRFAAACRSEDGTVVWDTATGRRAPVLDRSADSGSASRPVLIAGRLAWAGTDIIVSVGGYRSEEEIARPSIGFSGAPYRVVLRTLSSRTTRVAPLLHIPLGPIVVGWGGAVIGVTLMGEGVVVLDAATLDRRYPIVYISSIRSMAISDDGATVAAACEDNTRFQHPPRPDPIFVVDMKTGVARPLRPDCHTVAKSVAVAVLGSLALGLCLWLLWRTAPRREAKRISAEP